MRFVKRLIARAAPACTLMRPAINRDGWIFRPRPRWFVPYIWFHL